MSSDVSLYWMKTGNARKRAWRVNIKRSERRERWKRRKREVGGKARKGHRGAGTRRESVGPRESSQVGRSTRNGQVRMRSRGRKDGRQDTFPWVVRRHRNPDVLAIFSLEFLKWDLPP